MAHTDLIHRAGKKGNEEMPAIDQTDIIQRARREQNGEMPAKTLHPKS